MVPIYKIHRDRGIDGFENQLPDQTHTTTLVVKQRANRKDSSFFIFCIEFS